MSKRRHSIMKYNFIKHDMRYTHNTNKITLGAQNLSLGKEAFKSIGQPERIDIYFDTENKVIRLCESKDGRKIVKSKGYFRLTSTLSRIMPTGKYYYVEDGVFALRQKTT